VLGVGLEQRAVAQQVRSAHVEVARGAGVLERAYQRLQHVDDGDRLHHGVHPRRHGVHGHPFADLPDDLERGGPAAQEHRRAQHDHGRGDLVEDLLDLPSGRDVLGELRVGDVRNEPGEVDDPVDAVGSRPLGEVVRGLAVGLGEVVAAHPVDQVVDRVDAFADGRDLVGVEGVHDDGFYSSAPPRLLAVGVGRGGAHVVAAFEQQGHQSTANVAGRTCHQDLHLVLSSPSAAASGPAVTRD
jgi:hypothetical protein